MQSDLLAVPKGQLKPEMLLGTLTLFTVPDEPVDGTLLTRKWAAEGLDPKLIPDVRKPIHTFQQACRHVETRRASQSGTTHRVEVKVDEVVNGANECVYQITRMVRDAVNRVIDHPKAMRIVFNKVAVEAGNVKAAECITVEPLDPTAFGELKGLADRVEKFYDQNRAKVPGQKVRNAIRDYMRILGGENVRRKSGGVYFVPISGMDTLESITRVLDDIYPGGEADLHMIPLANTKGAAEMVAKHHTLNVVKECDEMIARISERLKSKGKVRKDLLTNMMQQRRELGARRQQYVSILGDEQKLANAHMETLDDQLEKLMEAAV